MRETVRDRLNAAGVNRILSDRILAHQRDAQSHWR
jgi:hypothetical protein